MPLTLTDEQVEILKKALRYMLIYHRAYFQNAVLFRTMKDSGDFEKVVSEPLKAILQWSSKDDIEKEEMRKRLLESAQTGKTPEDWYKNARKALKKEFKITGKDIAIVTGGAVAIGTALFIGGKLIKALSSNGNGKKKAGE